MPMYLTRFSYTPETWAMMIADPEDRRKAARPTSSRSAERLHGFWYAFGAYDGINLWEAPDNVSMAAVALAIGGGGALGSIETTVLLTVEETLDALARAQTVGYRAPGRRRRSGRRACRPPRAAAAGPAGRRRGRPLEPAGARRPRAPGRSTGPARRPRRRPARRGTASGRPRRAPARARSSASRSSGQRQVDVVVPADQHVHAGGGQRLAASGVGGRAGDQDRRRDRAGDQPARRVERGPPRDDGDRRGRRPAERRPQPADGGVRGHRPVPLGGRGAVPDQDDVGQRPQHAGRSAGRRASPGPRCGPSTVDRAVQRGDEVDPQVPARPAPGRPRPAPASSSSAGSGSRRRMSAGGEDGRALRRAASPSCRRGRAAPPVANRTSSARPVQVDLARLVGQVDHHPQRAAVHDQPAVGVVPADLHGGQVGVDQVGVRAPQRDQRPVHGEQPLVRLLRRAPTSPASTG